MNLPLQPGTRDRRDQLNDRTREDPARDNIPLTFFATKLSRVRDIFGILYRRFRIVQNRRAVQFISPGTYLAREKSRKGEAFGPRGPELATKNNDNLPQNRGRKNADNNSENREWFLADDKCALDRSNAHATETSNDSLARDWPARSRARALLYLRRRCPDDVPDLYATRKFDGIEGLPYHVEQKRERKEIHPT